MPDEYEISPVKAGEAVRYNRAAWLADQAFAVADAMMAKPKTKYECPKCGTAAHRVGDVTHCGVCGCKLADDTPTGDSPEDRG